MIGRRLERAALAPRHLTLGFADGGDVRIFAGAEGLTQLDYPEGAPPSEEAPFALAPGLVVAVTPTGRYVEPLAPREPPPTTGDAALDDHFYGPENWDVYLHYTPTPRFELEALSLLLDHGVCLVVTTADGPIPGIACTMAE